MPLLIIMLRYVIIVNKLSIKFMTEFVLALIGYSVKNSFHDICTIV